MVLLREEQIKHRVGETAKLVAEQLVESTSSYAPRSSMKKRGLIEGFGLDFFTVPTVASRHTTVEIQKRFAKAFQQCLQYIQNSHPFEKVDGHQRDWDKLHSVDLPGHWASQA